MSWLGWILLAAGLMVLFILWDLVFCDGKRCKEFFDWDQPGKGDKT